MMPSEGMAAGKVAACVAMSACFLRRGRGFGAQTHFYVEEGVEKQNSAEREQDQGHEEAVDGGDAAGGDGPGDAKKRDQAEGDGEQKGHGFSSCLPAARRA